MSAETLQPSSDNAMEFFTDPRSYRRFSTTRDNRRIFACIDPRIPGQVEDEARAHSDDLKVTIQTDGGAIGLGHDRSLRIGVETGQPIPISTGLEDEARERIVNVLDAHPRCKFLEAIVVVLEEEASPTEFTRESIDQWDDLYGIGLTNRSNRQIMDAAARQAELQKVSGESHGILDAVNKLYPKHPNVRHMAGENKSSLHVVNHHPLVGINRRKQDEKYGQTAQGYHNNLAAVVERSLVLPDLSPRGRLIRAGAAIYRAAATRTVLMAGNKDGRIMEVFPDPNTNHGLRFKEKTA